MSEDKPRQVRITCWVDEDLLLKFHRQFPVHGALTVFIRAALKRRVADIEQKTNKLLEGDNG